MTEDKDITEIISLGVIGVGSYLYFDTTIPKLSDRDVYYSVMEQFDITEDEAKKLVNIIEDTKVKIQNLLDIME